MQESIETHVCSICWCVPHYCDHLLAEVVGMLLVWICIVVGRYCYHIEAFRRLAALQKFQPVILRSMELVKDDKDVKGCPCASRSPSMHAPRAKLKPRPKSDSTLSNSRHGSEL